MPHLEDDPLGGDPFDAFDSGDEEIPCGQRDNLAAMFDLAWTLETPVPAQVGEPRAPPAPPLPPAAQTAPVAGPAPAIDLAMLVAALRESSPTSSQFSDQSEDESPPLWDEETLDLGIPPLNDRSALDHELLTAEGELDRTQVAAPQPTPGTSRATPSVYTRLGPPTDFMAETAREPPRSWRESWESPDFRFSRPVEFVPVIQALAKILNLKPPTTTSIQEDSQFLVWATWLSRPLLRRMIAGSSRMPTPLIIPPSHPPLSPMRNDRPGPVGGGIKVFRPPVASGHLVQICLRDGDQKLQD